MNGSRKQEIDAIKQVASNWRAAYRRLLTGNESDNYLLADFQEEVDLYSVSFYTAYMRKTLTKSEYQEIMAHWNSEVAEFALDVERFKRFRFLRRMGNWIRYSRIGRIFVEICRRVLSH